MRDDHHRSVDLNTELHAGPTINFKDPALPEHIALLSSVEFAPRTQSQREATPREPDANVQVRVELNA